MLTVDSEDVVDTKAEWDAADVLPLTAGFTTLDGGGAVLTGALATYMDQSTVLTGADITALVNPLTMSESVGCASVEWGVDVEGREIHSVTANLDPAAGGAKEVTTWVSMLFEVDSVDMLDAMGAATWSLRAITRPVEVTASVSAGDVTFTFLTNGTAAVLGGPPRASDAAVTAGAPTRTTTVMFVWAYKGEGAAASNVAWLCDSGNATYTDGVDIISRRTLSRIEAQDGIMNGTAFQDLGTAAGVPDCKFSGKTYAAATLSFTTDDIDIGSAPSAASDLVVVGQGSQNGGEIKYEITDGVQAYTQVYDGDVIGQDNSGTAASSDYGNEGADLSAFVRQQNYDMKVTLTPSTNLDRSPLVRRLGVQEVTSETVDGLVNFGAATWAVDPITMQSEIPSIEVELLRNGNRDYRSFVEDLFSTYHVGELHLRIWTGAPDLAKQYWLHVDDFIIDDYETVGASVKLYCVSPLVLINRDIPVSVGTQTPLVYTNQTLKAVYDDLITGQVGLPARYKGTGVEDTTSAHNVTKSMETKRKGLDELNRIAWIAGGSVISSQGRLKFASFFDQMPPDAKTYAHFPGDEIAVIGMSPGLRTRVTNYNVSHTWDQHKNEGRGNFTATAKAAHTTAITNLGRALIDITEEANDEISRWVRTITHAQDLADRQVKYFATGMMLWRVRSNIPYPHLEPGDPVTVESDRFVARDPNTGNPIRGPLTANARVQACHDIEGREFTLWVQDYADIDATSTTVANEAYGSAEVESFDVSYHSNGAVRVKATGNKDTANMYGTISASGTPSDPSAGANDVSMSLISQEVTSSVTAEIGDVVYVKMVAADVNGDLGEVVGERFTRGDSTDHPPKIQEQFDRTSATTAIMYLDIIDPSLSVTNVEFKKREGSEAADTFTSWLTLWDTSTGVAGTAKALVRAESLTTEDGQESMILYRVTWTDHLGVSQVIGGQFTSGNLDENASTVYYGFTDAQSSTSSTASGSYQNYLSPETSASQTYFMNTVLPVGVTITDYSVRFYRNSTGDVATVGLYEVSTAGALTQIGSTRTHGSTGWVTSTDSAPSQTVTAGVQYQWAITLDGATAGGQARFLYAAITFTRHSYKEGL